MCIKYADNNCSFLNYKVVLQKNYYSKPFLFFMLWFSIVMLPTYNFAEIKNLLRNINLLESDILTELVQEEIDRYPAYESKAIFKMILLQKKGISQNEVHVEYLLAYN